MNFLGFEITRRRADLEKKGMSAVNSVGGGGWFGLIREPFSGAWQSDVRLDGSRNVLAFSAVYSCVTIIASDIAKLSVQLLEEQTGGINVPVTRNSPYMPVLLKPNGFQTWFKFMEQWITSKLLFGNAYILKQRDGRGIVTAMYVLHGERVVPLVADNGDVYYRISKDYLSGVLGEVVVPASEIIHDMCVSLWHPLVGISPIFACGMSATMGNRIQSNSTRFFQNASRPSGMLTAPGSITDEVAERLKKAWDENYGGHNLGRLAVLGDGLKYEAMTIPAGEAQLIQQLAWTVQDVARCFHVPLWKIGAEAQPPRVSVEAMQQTYYGDCLQPLIEAAEDLLDDGLGLNAYGSPDMHVEFDLRSLLRMDTASRYTALQTAVAGGWMAPNEARASENLPPVAGGDIPYLQQQNFSLEALAKRDALDDPFAAAKPPPPAPITAPAALPAPAKPEADDSGAQAAALLDYVSKGLQWL